MKRSPRHGVALLIVMGVLTITLAIGYAMTRTAGLGSSLETNLDRQAAARAAALTGMNLALRAMHQPTWSGVGSQLSATIDDGVHYAATFAAGDPRLAPGSAQYDRWPYRVTIEVVGTADHPLHSTPATERLTAVVELVPRKVQDASAANQQVQPFAVYHWGDRPLDFDLPARIEGPLYTQGELDFLASYPVESLRPFRGYVDEVALYSKALSASQIKSIYDAAPGGNAPALYAAHQPMVWWRLNETPGALTAADERGVSAANYAGAQSGQSQVPFATAVRSALLDGIHDNIRTGNISPGGNRLTILMWFRPTELPNSTMRLMTSAYDASDWGHDWALSVVPGGGHRLRFQWRVGFGLATLDASSGLAAGQWTFVAAVLDGNTATLYQNGVAVGQTTALSSPTFYSASRVMLGDSFPGSSRRQLVRDQYRMFAQGAGDLRALTGPLHIPSSKLPDEVRALCVDDLGVSIQTIAEASSAPLAIPTGIRQYRLYPGGPLYSIPLISGAIADITLSPDPASNPLGIFCVRGDATLYDDVSIEGTLLFESNSSRLRFRGQRIAARAMSLPALEGASQAWQLPLALVPDETHVEDTAGAIQLSGQWLTGEDFKFAAGSGSMKLDLEGSVVAERLRIEPRSNWSQSDFIWRLLLSGFLGQLGTNGGAAYFPQYLASSGLDQSPAFTVRVPADAPAGYLWPDFAQPLFEAHPDDGGLRWKWLGWIHP